MLKQLRALAGEVPAGRLAVRPLHTGSDQVSSAACMIKIAASIQRYLAYQVWGCVSSASLSEAFVRQIRLRLYTVPTLVLHV